MKIGCAATSPTNSSTPNGTLVPELQALAPTGERRISANPHANGGLLRKELELPDFRKYAVKVKSPGSIYAPPTDVLAHFLAEVMRRNMNSFRVFGPDETASNRLTAIYAASKKTWLAEYKPEDADGGELDVSGRVMEMLSEHTLEGWFEGYVLTGRHGFFSTYEAFVHVIDSMFNQHAKWLEKSKKELGLARSGALDQHPYYVAGLAAGSQRLHPSRPWISGCSHKQERRRGSHLSAARRELPAERDRPLFAFPRLRQCHRRRQAGPSSVPDDGRSGKALHKRHRHLGLGVHG